MDAKIPLANILLYSSSSNICSKLFFLAPLFLPLARPPSFFPGSSLPPVSNGSFAAEIHTDVSPTPRERHTRRPPASSPGSLSFSSPSLFTPLALPALLPRLLLRHPTNLHRPLDVVAETETEEERELAGSRITGDATTATPIALSAPKGGVLLDTLYVTFAHDSRTNIESG
ncbi:hypothetical protein PUN28_016578 [Cardiocondyla obscurior]|uniref:Uncharacterized protein n=1 Tax=Cardiocondyla obscurior TaxID=286306 RepID=A0AAW2EPW4_9HYME